MVRPVPFVASWLSLGLVGCAHGATAMLPDDDARIAALEDEVASLRRTLPVAETPTAARTVAVTDSRPDADVQATVGAPTVGGVLTVDEGADVAGEAVEDAPGARIVLRLHEDATPVPTVSERLPVADMPPLPPIPAAAPVVSAPVAGPAVGTAPASFAPEIPAASVAAVPPAVDGDLTAYRAGLAHLTARRYEAAVASISAFLRDNPGSPRADDAMYFRATANYAMRRYREALIDYERVLRIAPTGDRAADALLHSALCHRRLGDDRRAMALLEQLRQRYPDSVAARLAAREDSI